jgi:hypothetical protein
MTTNYRVYTCKDLVLQAVDVRMLTISVCAAYHDAVLYPLELMRAIQGISCDRYMIGIY